MGFMDVRLLVSHPTAETKQLRLGAETLIGRSTECNMRIASGQVSRRHCLIHVAEGKVTVRDLGSANGTRLNGLAIAPEVDIPIAPGSTLVVGPLKFVVQFAPPREKGDEDTEYLPGGLVPGQSGTHEIEELASAPIVDGEETKDFPRTQQRLRGKVPPVIVAKSGANDAETELAGPGHAEHESDGMKTDPDFPPVTPPVDAGETIYDGSLRGDRDPSIHANDSVHDRPRQRSAAETQLYFEEDDVEKLATGSGDPDEDLRKFLEGK